MGCSLTKLPETSETSIAITFLVVNLSRLLRQFLSLFLSLFLEPKTDELTCRNYIKINYVCQEFIAAKLIDLAENYWLKAA